MTFADLFRKWGLDSIKLNIGFAQVEWKSTEDDQTAAWDMYVELITRITTQPLEEYEGDESTALKSIYDLFPITRMVLKEKGKNAGAFTRVAIIVLNQVVRPFTAKWHKKQLEGAFKDEKQCILFREELKELQNRLICYTGLLADMAEVESYERIARFARMERISGAVVSNEESASERTGTVSGTISGSLKVF